MLILETPVFTSLRDQTAGRVEDFGLLLPGQLSSEIVWTYHPKYTGEGKKKATAPLLDTLVQEGRHDAIIS